MIQGISQSNSKYEPTKVLSFQFTEKTPKAQPEGQLASLSPSTSDLILKETLVLIKGIAVDILQAAINSLTQPEVPKQPEAQIPPANASTGNTATDLAGNGLNVSPTNTTEATPRKNESLSSFLQRELTPNGDGNFHEEQLQYGVAGYLLNEKSPEAYKKFKEAYGGYKSQTGSRSSYEDGVKVALKSLVAAKQLTKAEAEDINGKSFRSAQLDKDLNTLFDDKGGQGDNTVAVMNAKEAAEKVDRAYGRIRRGETDVSPRSLDAASNTKSTSSSGSIGMKGGAGSGFLWKPISDSDGKLVILAPTNISRDVESISVYKNDSDGKKTLIEKGRSVGLSNGDRATFRFKQAGSGYPDGAIVEIKLKNGEVVSEVIKETSSRVEK